MEVFFDCESSVSPSPRVYMKTLPIYLNCVRRRVAKMFLNQRTHPDRVSVSLVCPSVSFFMPFYYKPNVLESICDRSLKEAPIQPQFQTPVC